MDEFYKIPDVYVTSLNNWGAYDLSGYQGYSGYGAGWNMGPVDLPPIEVAAPANNDLNRIYFDPSPIGDPAGDSSSFSLPAFPGTQLITTTNWRNLSPAADIAAGIVNAVGSKSWPQTLINFVKGLIGAVVTDIGQQTTYSTSLASPLNNPRTFQKFDPGYGYPNPATFDFTLLHYPPTFAQQFNHW